MDDKTRAEIAELAALAANKAQQVEDAPNNVVRPSVFNRPLPSQRRIAQASQGIEQPSFGPQRSAQPAPLPTSRLFHADELLAKPVPPRRWIVERWIPQAETTLLAGDGGSGKTTLAMQLAVACASGTEWLGMKVEPCSVLYVSAEDPTDELHFRLDRIRAQLQQPISLAGLHFLDLAGEPATIATFERNGKLKLEALFGYIEGIASEWKAGLMILDAAADFFGGNENERSEVRAFIGALRGLAMRLDAAVLIIAHPSVDGIKTGRGYSGSTHWNNGVRSRATFTKLEKTQENPNPDPDARTLELSKSNRARAGDQIHMRWSAGIFMRVTPGTGRSTVSDLHAEQVFLDLLAKRNAQKRYVSHKKGPSYAPAVLAEEPKGRELGKASLRAAMDRLFDKKAIQIAQYGRPSNPHQYLMAMAHNNPVSQ